MNPLHPCLAEQLVRQHRRDLLALAANPQRRAPRAARPGGASVRERAGWRLVEIGLRLAGAA
jgi:hypothetical protein